MSVGARVNESEMRKWDTRKGGMSRPSYTRLSALSGALFIVAFNLALFDLGAPPKASDSSAQVASILVGAHGRILGGMYLAGLALMLGICFFATVRSWLIRASDSAEAPLADTAFAGGLFAIALGLLGMLLYYGATYKVAGDSGPSGLSVVRALTDGGNAAIELTKFPLATFIIAVSLAASRTGPLPRWFVRVGTACAAVLLASAIPLFSHGSFTQFGGGLDVIGGAPAVLWIFTLSLIMGKHVSP
jgi:hypothetical protein